MEKLEMPLLEQINGNDIVIKRLRDCPEYAEDFIYSITNAIDKAYDEITTSFAENLIRIDKNGFDEYGFFSLGKDIWVVFDKEESCLLGYEVITRKRGGCIKIGPTYIKPFARGKGYAVQTIRELITVYRELGARKVYVTAPLGNQYTLSLDFQHLAFKLEIILHKHYSDKGSERVCGKFIAERTVDTPLIPRVHYGSRKFKSVLINDFGNYSSEEFSRFIVRNMAFDYDDIDETFVDGLYNGVNIGLNTNYEKKGKLLVNSFSDSSLESVAVITLKRGGVMKVNPFIIKDDFLCFENIERILEEIEKKAIEYRRRKITFLISVRDIIVANILCCNQYICEGVIREPYKIGIDMIVLSRFLS